MGGHVALKTRLIHGAAPKAAILALYENSRVTKTHVCDGWHSRLRCADNLSALRPFILTLSLPLLTMTIISTANAQGWQKASTLPGTHRATAQELKTLRTQFARKYVAYDFDAAGAEVHVHSGDLIVSGPLENDSLLIVQGDLTIEGNYRDSMSHFGVLVVLGQMRVENLYSWGSIYVQNDLNASGLILTVYNDFTFQVDGKVNARALVISDKSADYTAGKIGITLNNGSSETEPALALRTFEPDFFTRPESLDIADIPEDLRFDDGLGSKRIRDGGPIFRAKMAQEALITDVAHALSEAASLETLVPLITRDPLLAQLIAGRPELPEALYAPLFATRDPIVLEWLAMRAPKFMAAQQLSQNITITPKLAEEPQL